MLDRITLIESWRREERAPFAGWDFSYLDGRMIEGQAPWSYTTRAGELLDGASSALDLDTGGGERLLMLRPHWPARVVATEAYPPNVAVARDALAPHRARVVRVSSEDETPFPFADGAFDVVLNRHASFDCAEIARMLVAGGVFLTQQVHGRWAEDLLACFNATPPYPDASVEQYVPRLLAAGMEVTDVREWTGTLAFTDVGAIVYYLKAAPWMVPHFGVDRHLSELLALQARLDAGEELSFIARKYLIEAHKPG